MKKLYLVLMFLSVLFMVPSAQANKVRLPGLFSPGTNPVLAADLSNQAPDIYFIGPVFHSHTVDFTLGSSFNGDLYQCDTQDADIDEDGNIDASANCLLITNLVADIFVPANSSRRRYYILKVNTAETEGNISTLTIKGTFSQVHVFPEILLIGDSFTEGTLSLSNGTDITGCFQDACYVARLTVALGNKFKIINAGKGGATTADFLPGITGIPFIGTDFFTDSRPLFDATVAPRLPSHVVVIFLGANDATGFFEPAPLTPEQYNTNLNTIVNAVIGSSFRVILLNPSQLFSQPQAVQDRITAYALEVQTICASNSKIVCGENMLNVLGPTDFGGASIHPTAQGHQKIADSLFATIISLFPNIVI